MMINQIITQYTLSVQAVAKRFKDEASRTSGGVIRSDKGK